jgi:CP family cyanate transporter-like MFS transporter
MTTPASEPSHSSHSAVSPFASLLGIVLIAAALRTPLTTIGPLLGHIRAGTGLSLASAGLLNTLPLLALGLGSLAAPVLGRRWGLERVLFYSMLLLSAGIVLRSLFGVGALFTGTLLLGAAIAIGNVLLPALIKRDYPQRIGRMTGLFVFTMALSSGIAAGVAVPLAGVLPGDWRASLACALVISVPAAFVWGLRARHADARAAATHAAPHANVWGSWLAWQVTLLNGIQAMSFSRWWRGCLPCCSR